MGVKISVVIGPPGCGKTTTLSHWCERAVSRYGYDKAIVCSLTRTAAYRAARTIELPYQQFGTVHAFAYRALGQPVLAEAKLDEWNKAYPNLQLAGHGQARTPDDGYLMPEETTVADHLKLEYSRLRTMGIPPSAVGWQRASLRGFAERWQDWKAGNHYVDFVDLLEQAYKEIDAAPGEPAVMCVDECLGGDTPVTLEDGTTRSIKDLVQERYSGKVLSYNHVKGVVEAKRVTGWYTTPLQDRTLMKVGELVATEDHPVFTNEYGYCQILQGMILGNVSLLQLECTGANIYTTRAVSARTLGCCWVDFRGCVYPTQQTLSGTADTPEAVVYCLDVEDNHNFFAGSYLVHNCQDIGNLEIRLMMKWAKKAEHLVLAGDPGQSLFQFRGTDPLLLQRLWDEHDPDRKPLTQSYRLPQAVYDYAWTWQQRFQFTRRVEYNPRKDNQNQVVGGFVRRGPAFATVTPRVIEQALLPYLDEGKDVVIMATCGYMLDPVINVLRGMGIPFANSLRPNNGKWNPLPQKRGRGYTIVDRVLAFSRPRVDLWGEAAHFWTPSELKAWASALPATGIFSRGGIAAIQGLSDEATDKELSDACSTWFIAEALQAIVPKPDLTWYLSHVKGSDNLREYVYQVISRYGVHKLQDKPLIQIGTVHSYKGGESDIVWLSPDLSLDASFAAHKDPQAAEEMRRVFYTGITRAREGLLLADASTRNCVMW